MRWFADLFKPKPTPAPAVSEKPLYILNPTPFPEEQIEALIRKAMEQSGLKGTIFERYTESIRLLFKKHPPWMEDGEQFQLDKLNEALRLLVPYLPSKHTTNSPLTYSLAASWKLDDPRRFPGYSLISRLAAGETQDTNTKITEDILSLQIPLRWPNEKRFEHTQIVGSAGSGKTTVLSHLILFDLNQDDPPGLILIDPKRTVINKLSRLAVFDSKLKDRLIIISPKYNPAINIFDTTNRPSNVGAIQSVEYLCSMLGQDMTGKQRGLYRNLGNLLLHFKEGLGRHATLLDLLELTARKFPPQYAPVVATLQPVQRRFFESGDFESPDYRETKDQIRTRLNSLLASEGMSNLFSSQENAINLFDELNKGSIILVDTGEGDPLDREESAAFGCIFMSEIVRVVLQRTPLQDKGRPAFVYVDEAATFFVGAGIIEDFLTSGRQNKIGGIFSFHTLSQAGDDLRSILVTNTSTKLLSKYAVDDIATFGRHMSLSVEEMKAMPDYHWACSIRGVADKAVTITCPPDELDNEPTMSEAAYQQLIERNRRKVGAQQQHQQQPPPPPPPGGSKKKWTGPKPTWTQQDEQALADAYHQLAVMMRRGNTKRAEELKELIAGYEARKAAAQEDNSEDDYQL